MRKWHAMLMLCVTACAGASLAQEPPRRDNDPPPMYRILRAPSSPHPHHAPMRGVRQGYVTPTMRRPYAYGWFGVPPRHHQQWVRHFGYYRSYTQWSTR